MDPKHPSTSQQKRPRARMEEIPFDLSSVPTVKAGLRAAANRYQRFTRLAVASLDTGEDRALLIAHLPLMSFINRAVSLHAGVVSAVRDHNPHAAFTLLRAYLELVGLVFYVNAHPDCLAALERPKSALPPNTLKRFAEMFDFAAAEMPGINHVYDVLNEMAHFGSTALWRPLTVEEVDKEEVEEGEGPSRRIALSTAPHWKRPDGARVALAMLAEADDATFELLRRYDARYVRPAVQRLTEPD